MKYVIYNPFKRMFWSVDGLTDLEHADQFNDQFQYALPEGCIWIPEHIANMVLWPGCHAIVNTPGDGCLHVTAVVTVSLAVELAFDNKALTPDEPEFREILLQNFAAHPALEDKGTALGLKYEIVDAHEE